MSAVVPYQPSPTTGLMPSSIDQALSLAQLMAKAKLVPECLQNSPGDCLMVVEQAMRWGMSPFAVAQCTASVRGRLMYEGKLVAAVVNSSPILEGDLDYEFSGAGNDRSVLVTGKLRDGRTRAVTVKLADILTYEKDGSLKGMWKKQPDQQLCYGGARVWARRWAPQLMLGVYTPDEFDEAQSMRDVTPRQQQQALPQPAETPTPAPTPAAVFEVQFPGGPREFPRTGRGARDLLDALHAEPGAVLNARAILDSISARVPALAAEIADLIAAAMQAPGDDFPGDTP